MSVAPRNYLSLDVSRSPRAVGGIVLGGDLTPIFGCLAALPSHQRRRRHPLERRQIFGKNPEYSLTG